MNEQQIALAVAAWVEETLPGLARVYPYVTAGKAELPDAVVDVTTKRLIPEDLENFPFAQLQQSWLRVFTLELSIMTALEPADGASIEEGSADVAQRETEQLRGFGAALEAALYADTTLGERVYMASPRLEIDYAAPFVEYADGTRGRQFVASMAVAEPIEGLG